MIRTLRYRVYGAMEDDYTRGQWVFDYREDPRTPRRDGVPYGPWLTRGSGDYVVTVAWNTVFTCPRAVPVHGIVSREHPSGLTEWAAVLNGWPQLRWAGPRMTWTHSAVSPWNPILAQWLNEDRPGYPSWRVNHDAWTGDAILAGRKPSGYFGIRPRRKQSAAVEALRTAGFDVGRIGRQRLSSCCWAAAPGALCDHISHEDLQALADEYRRVLLAFGLCPGIADAIEADLHDYAHTSVMDLAIGHETVPSVICGLVLGYPPEVTAGDIMRCEWRPDETGGYTENGAFDEKARSVVGPAAAPAGEPAS